MKLSDCLEYQITEITPIYDYDQVGGGHFCIQFNHDKDRVYRLSFLMFLDHLVSKDQKLFDYIKKTSSDKTCSHVVSDLYEIAYPVNEQVEKHIQNAQQQVGVDVFNALIRFYAHLLKMGGGSSGSLE